MSYVLGYWDGILHHKFMMIMYDFLLNWYMKVEELFSKILLKDYMFLYTYVRKSEVGEQLLPICYMCSGLGSFF
jgi:hypothetical protein